MRSSLFCASGPGTGRLQARPAPPVCVRFPGNPLISVLMRKPDAGHFENSGPANAAGLRTTPRKPFDFGFDAQTGHRAF